MRWLRARRVVSRGELIGCGLGCTGAYQLLSGKIAAGVVMITVALFVDWKSQ